MSKQSRKQKRKNIQNKRRNTSIKIQNKRIKHKGGQLIKPPVVRPCNPEVILNKKNATQDTCLTNPLLQKLIEIHNKLYPKSKIKQSSAQDVLRILREKNRECIHSTHTDKCILKKAGLEKHVDKVFAPEHDWKTSNEWLSNFDIKAVMDMYSKLYPHFHFFGPVPIDFDNPDVCPGNGDNLCNFNLEKELNSGKTKFGFIFNLDFNKGPGTHWVSMFYDASPANPKESLLFFFDSAGKKNTPNDRFSRIHNLAERIIQQAQNSEKYKQLREHPPVLLFNDIPHQKSNTECGVYSLFFVITMLTRKPDIAQLNELSNSELLDLFYGKNEIIPDHYIEQYRNVFFTKPV